jgi:hypothetical protein
MHTKLQSKISKDRRHFRDKFLCFSLKLNLVLELLNVGVDGYIRFKLVHSSVSLVKAIKRIYNLKKW